MAGIFKQFLAGIKGKVIPQIRLTKCKDYLSGQALFRFENPYDFVKYILMIFKEFNF